MKNLTIKWFTKWQFISGTYCKSPSFVRHPYCGFHRSAIPQITIVHREKSQIRSICKIVYDKIPTYLFYEFFNMLCFVQ